ncbi:MAG: hypothetical protein ACRD6I_18505, partial [Candidatus Acidiferrales bacterium]
MLRQGCCLPRTVRAFFPHDPPILRTFGGALLAPHRSTSTGTVERDLFTAPLDFAVLNDFNTASLIHMVDNIIAQGLKPNIKLGSVPLKFTQANGGPKLSLL